MHVCDVTHPYLCVWGELSVCVRWLIHIYVCEVSCLYVWGDSFICGDTTPSLICPVDMCDMSHWYVCHVILLRVDVIHHIFYLLTCVTCLIHMCYMSYSYVTHWHVWATIVHCARICVCLCVCVCVFVCKYLNCTYIHTHTLSSATILMQRVAVCCSAL